MSLNWSIDGPVGIGGTKKPLVKRNFVTDDLLKEVPFMQYMWGEISKADAGAMLSYEGAVPGESWRVRVLEKGKKFRVQQFVPMTASQAAIQVSSNEGFIWTIPDLKAKNVPENIILQVSKGAVGAAASYPSIAGTVRVVRHADDAFSVYYGGKDGDTRIPPTEGLKLPRIIPPEEDPLVWQMNDLVSHGVPKDVMEVCLARMKEKNLHPIQYHDFEGHEVSIRVRVKGIGYEVVGFGAGQQMVLSRMGNRMLGYNEPPTSLVECNPIVIKDSTPESETYVWKKHDLLHRGLLESDLPGDMPGACKVQYTSQTYDRIDCFRLLSGHFSVYVNGCPVEPGEKDVCITPYTKPVDPGTLTMYGELIWTDEELAKSNVPAYIRHQLQTTSEAVYSSDDQVDIVRIVKFGKDCFHVRVGDKLRAPSDDLLLARGVHNVQLWGADQLVYGGVPPEIVALLQDNHSVCYLGKTGLYYSIQKSEGGGYIVRRHRDTTTCYRHGDQEIAADEKVIAELHKLMPPADGVNAVAQGQDGGVADVWPRMGLKLRGMPDFVFDECDMPDHGGVCQYIGDEVKDVITVTKVADHQYTVYINGNALPLSSLYNLAGHPEEEIPLDPDWVWTSYVLTEAGVPDTMVEDLKNGKIGAEVNYSGGAFDPIRIWKVAPNGYHVQAGGENYKPSLKLNLSGIKLHKTADGFTIPIGPSKHDGPKIPLSKIPQGPDPENIMFTLTDLRRAKVPSTVIKRALDLTEPGTFTTYLAKGGIPIRIQAAPEGNAGMWVVIWNNKFLDRHDIWDLSGTLPRKPREPKELTPLQQRFANITDQLITKRRRRNAKDQKNTGPEGEAQTPDQGGQ